MFYRVIVVNQKSQKAGIPLSPKQTRSIVGSLLYIKAFCQAKAVKGAVTPVGGNNQWLCVYFPKAREALVGMTLTGEHRAESKGRFWNMKSEARLSLFTVSSSQPQACTLFPSCPQFTENYLSNMLTNPKFWKKYRFPKNKQDFFNFSN